MGVSSLEAIPTTPEGKFQFASQGDYEKAVQERISTGDNISELQNLMNYENVVINSDLTNVPQTTQQEPQAEPSSQELTGTPAGAVESPTEKSQQTEPDTKEPAQKPQLTQSFVDQLKAKAKEAGIDFTYADENQIIDGMINKEKRISYLNSKVNKANEVMSEADSLKAEVERLRQENEKLVRQPTPQTSTPSSDIPSSRKEDIGVLRKKLREIDDPFSDEYAKTQAQLNDLMLDEMNRLEVLSTRVPATSSVSAEIETLKSELAVLKERETTRDQETQAQLKYNSDMSAIDKFQRSHQDFATKKSISDLDKDYMKFTDELFQLKYGRAPQSNQERKSVYDDFVGYDLELKGNVKNIGLEIPVEMDKYMKICDLLIARDQMNKAFGKDHELETVLIYDMAQNGTLQDAMMKQRDIGANAVTTAAEKRSTDYAQQLSADTGASPEETGDQMSQEEAVRVMNTISAQEAKTDPNKMAALNQAFVRLGMPPVGS